MKTITIYRYSIKSNTFIHTTFFNYQKLHHHHTHAPNTIAIHRANRHLNQLSLAWKHISIHIPETADTHQSLLVFASNHLKTWAEPESVAAPGLGEPAVRKQTGQHGKAGHSGHTGLTGHSAGGWGCTMPLGTLEWSSPGWDGQGWFLTPRGTPELALEQRTQDV